MATQHQKDALTLDHLKSSLDYDPETGIFTWKYRPWVSNAANAKLTGKRAGSVQRTERYHRRRIRIDDVLFFEHQLAWFYMTGGWPDMIDHKNHDATDNRWDNLRQTDSIGNGRNGSRRINNTTGYNGVQLASDGIRYVAICGMLGARHHLGTFDTAEEANEVGMKFRVEHGFDESHGQTKSVHADHVPYVPDWPLSSPNSTSGIKNIYWSPRHNGWQVRPTTGGKNNRKSHLVGYFKELDEALMALLEWRLENGLDNPTA